MAFDAALAKRKGRTRGSAPTELLKKGEINGAEGETSKKEDYSSATED